MARTPIVVDCKTIGTSVLLSEEADRQVQPLAAAIDASCAAGSRMTVQKFLDEHQGQLYLPLRLSA